jgi:membrane complex biogenesis BtpA family protein
MIGVVHLPALPGSPQSRLPLESCVELAVRDALVLDQSGCDAVIVENFNDVPFRPRQVDAHTVAAMTAACMEIRRSVKCEVGVNVLRNDAEAALSVALAAGGSFIRVNVHTGVMLTDQGIIRGRADDTLRLRRALGAEHVHIYADVLVKHAVPLGPQTVPDAIRDCVERGLADAVIVTGTATGAAASREDVRLAARVSRVPVYVGSGVTDANIDSFLPAAAGVIVGSWLKVDGKIANPVDPVRVRRLRAKVDRVTANSTN